MTSQAAQEHLRQHGWVRLGPTADSVAWAVEARAVGLQVLDDPAMQAKWLVCEGTWFVGVDALPTTPQGALNGVPLAGPAIELLAPLPNLHPAQLSVTYPGYPRPRDGESDAAFAYRLKRDAAHVDGLLAQGPERRRTLSEPHAYILGLPLSDPDPLASPLVVWEGSHRHVQDALRKAFAAHPQSTWDRLDITKAYQAARRHCFDACQRVELVAAPGEALLLHRAVVHGIAPWLSERASPRMIAYFRPPQTGGIPDWLDPDRLF